MEIRKRIYVSGAISRIGHPGVVTAEDIAAARERFQKAAVELMNKGNDVVIPLDNGLSADAPYEKHLAAGILLLSTCNAIYMLPDWRRSHGARLELHYAEYTGKEIIYEQSPLLGDVKTAIETAFGLDFTSIAAPGIELMPSLARMIFAYNAAERGLHPSIIANEINRSRPTAIRLIDQYESEYRYNRRFAHMCDRVSELLAHNNNGSGTPSTARRTRRKTN